MLAMDAQSVGLKDARVHGQSDSSQARTFTHNGDETQSLTILESRPRARGGRIKKGELCDRTTTRAPISESQTAHG